MHRNLLLTPLSAFLALSSALAQQPSTAPTSLTIYNQDFAVARTTVPLDLKSGSNEVLTTNVTSMLEPDSVVLRDPSGHNTINIVEQNYDAGVVNQQWLIDKYEGKTLDFQTYGMQVIETTTGERKTLPATTIPGKIIRAGSNPLIEVNGKLQFQLPGMPLFPANVDGLLLKPTLRWQIESATAAGFPAELAYVTRGFNWHATYNLVLPSSSESTSNELADILGWVTIQNNSGTDFPQATIQLIAGDVRKLQEFRPKSMLPAAVNQSVELMGSYRKVTQEAFDDFHLYDLHRTLALRNAETKQVQFLEASGVNVQRTYVYDVSNYAIGPLYASYHDTDRFRGSSDTTVSILEEIKNSEANHLGMPLPAGRLRLYRRDTSGQMQFVGEAMISHTPAEQTVKMTSGNAFDLTGTHRQTDYHIDENAHTIDESFEIKLSNQKSQPITIHAVEHLYRAANWNITEKSNDFTKRDSNTIDFPITVPAKGDKTFTYTVHYTWQ
jgi:hypothetical protein